MSLRLLLLLGFFSISVVAQKNYKIHSHNDYGQDFPFWKAYVSGASSIEIDVFLQHGKLYVTHAEEEISPEKTIENLYLDPLSKLAKSGKLRKVQILVDIKSDARKTLEKLVKIVKNRPELAENNNLRFVISGNRPQPSEYKNYPDFIHFDHQVLENLTNIALEKIALVSVSFKDFSVWNGLGRMTETDLARVKDAIAQAHAVHKPFRFWGSPDTETAWSHFAELGVDFINTDHPVRASQYLETLDSRKFQLQQKIPVYHPHFAYAENEKPKNVVLLIGDGNGLSQISSAMIANGGALTVTQLKTLGLIKTFSFDDLVTDSAAGGTAMATGAKTNNRAIGTDPSGKPLKNITETLSAHGFLNGVMTTDKITGATPSTFYAHVPERDDSATILKDLAKSKIDFFVSAGANDFDAIQQDFERKKLADITDFSKRTAVFLSENNLDTASKRGTIFPEHVKKVLQTLENQEKPYFLMIEAAKIDSNGHNNNVSGIVEEMLDFDQAIAEVLKVADKNENTLVVITADHETSGFGILQGSLENGELKGGFLTNDHTATMVPLFAYGPQSGLFQGVFENTEIHNKIMQALQIEVAKK